MKLRAGHRKKLPPLKKEKLSLSALAGHLVGHSNDPMAGDIRRRIAEMLEGRRVGPPRVVHLDIVGACNINCVYCRDHSPLVPGSREAWRNQPMPIGPALGLVKQAASLGAEVMPILGAGEPLLHPGLTEIIDAIHKTRMQYELYTNGILFDERRAAYFAQRPNGKIAFSVSAADDAAWAMLRPEMRGMLGVIHKNIKRLASIRSQGKPIISIVHVLCNHNFNQVIPMTEQAVELGADEVYFKIAELADPFAAGLKMTAEQVHSLELEIRHCRNIAGKAGLGFADQVLFELARYDVSTGLYARRLYDRIPCLMGHELIRVRRDGQISFCCGLKFMADAAKTSLADHWFGDDMRRARMAAVGFPKGANHVLPDGSMLRDESCDYCYNHAMNQVMADNLARIAPINDRETEGGES